MKGGSKEVMQEQKQSSRRGYLIRLAIKVFLLEGEITPGQLLWIYSKKQWVKVPAAVFQVFPVPSEFETANLKPQSISLERFPGLTGNHK